MDAERLIAVRKELTIRETQALENEVLAWLERRDSADAEIHQYTTQLQALRTLFTSALDGLKKSVALIPAATAGGTSAIEPLLESAYLEYRELDKVILWLRRVWLFFRERFDQRDFEPLQATLRAADEVVWSCYHAVFGSPKARQLQIAHGPAPLPYIDSFYSPYAYPREEVPRELRTEIDRHVLTTLLPELPIPVVRLPPVCTRAPWWLVYLAHEVGHHVQYDLLPNRQLVTRFAEEAIVPAIRSIGGSEDDVERWNAWSAEIFADVFSVLVVGPAAIRAMVELEYASPTTMALRRTEYPSPVVRLELMRRVWNELVREATEDELLSVPKLFVMDADCALRQLNLTKIAGTSSESQSDWQQIDAIVAAALGPLPGLGVRLVDLCQFSLESFDAQRPLWAWIEARRQEIPVFVTGHHTEDARLVAAAALIAWDQSIQSEGLGWEDACEQIARTTCPSIIAARQDGVRADLLPVGDASEQGRMLVYRLRKILAEERCTRAEE